MQLPENLSEPRLDEKSSVENVKNGLGEHREVAGPRNGADEEDPEGLGPVSSGRSPSLLNEPGMVSFENLLSLAR